MCFSFTISDDPSVPGRLDFVTPDCPQLAGVCAARRSGWQEGREGRASLPLDQTSAGIMPGRTPTILGRIS
jgi:hypothetical protein